MATSTVSQNQPHPRDVAKERLLLLRKVDQMLNRPMLVLGIVWLVLLVAQLVYGTSAWSNDLTVAIWALSCAEGSKEITSRVGAPDESK